MEQTAVEKAVLFLLREFYYANGGNSACRAQDHIEAVDHEIAERLNPTA